MPDNVSSQIKLLQAREFEELRKRYRAIPKDGQGSQPRIALTAALNEATHRVYGTYRAACEAYTKFASECDGRLAVVQERNFRNLLQRATTGGEAFDIWDVAVFLLSIDERAEQAVALWRATLTPYQIYLLGWVRDTINAKRYTQARDSNDSGGKTTVAKTAAYRVENFVDDLRALQLGADLDELFTRPDGTISDDTRFVSFRSGLDDPLNVVQGYIHLFSPTASKSEFYTFSINYVCEDSSKFVGGVVIPSTDNIYLFGFQGWGDIKKGEIANRIGMRNSLELIAIPRDRVGHGRATPALTMSSDSTDQLLVARIALRPTNLQDEKSAGAAVYPFADLDKHLAKLIEAEARLGGKALEDKQKARAVRADAKVIGLITNNRTHWKMVELLGEGGKVKASAFFKSAIDKIFLDDDGNARFKDRQGVDYNERAHRRSGSIGIE